MLNHMGLGFVFTAQDLASAKLRGLEQNFVRLDNTTQASGARIGASFRRIAVGFGVLAAGGAAVGSAFALANQAGKFEQGLASVAAVAQASTEEPRAPARGSDPRRHPHPVLARRGRDGSA